MAVAKASNVNFKILPLVDYFKQILPPPTSKLYKKKEVNMGNTNKRFNKLKARFDKTIELKRYEK